MKNFIITEVIADDFTSNLEKRHLRRFNSHICFIEDGGADTVAETPAADNKGVETKTPNRDAAANDKNAEENKGNGAEEDKFEVPDNLKGLEPDKLVKMVIDGRKKISEMSAAANFTFTPEEIAEMGGEEIAAEFEPYLDGVNMSAKAQEKLKQNIIKQAKAAASGAAENADMSYAKKREQLQEIFGMDASKKIENIKNWGLAMTDGNKDAQKHVEALLTTVEGHVVLNEIMEKAVGTAPALGRMQQGSMPTGLFTSYEEADKAVEKAGQSWIGNTELQDKYKRSIEELEKRGITRKGR